VLYALQEPAVLLFCKFVVQADVVMLALQILWGIIYGSMTATHTDASIFVVDFVLTISITLCSLVLSIEGVKHRNPELYFGMGYFEFCAAWHAVGCLFKVAFLIINIFEGTIFAIVFDAIFFVFYCIGYYRCRELLSLLYMPQNIKKTSEMESESAEHKEADNAV